MWNDPLGLDTTRTGGDFPHYDDPGLIGPEPDIPLPPVVTPKKPDTGSGSPVLPSSIDPIEPAQNGGSDGGGPNWQGGWEAFVQAFVPFGSDFYPAEDNGIIEATVPEWLTPGGAGIKGAKGTYTVYRAIAKDGKPYWGITKDLIRRARQHGARFPDGLQAVYKNVSKSAARGLEQLKIDQHGLKNLDNAINIPRSFKSSEGDRVDLKVSVKSSVSDTHSTVSIMFTAMSAYKFDDSDGLYFVVIGYYVD